MQADERKGAKAQALPCDNGQSAQKGRPLIVKNMSNISADIHFIQISAISYTVCIKTIELICKNSIIQTTTEVEKGSADMRKLNSLFHNYFQDGLSMMVIAMAPGVFDDRLFSDDDRD